MLSNDMNINGSLSISEVLRATFKTLKEAPLAIFGISLLAALVSGLMEISLSSVTSKGAKMYLTVLCQGIIVLIAFQSIAGKKPSISASFKYVSQRLASLVLLLLLLILLCTPCALTLILFPRPQLMTAAGLLAYLSVLISASSVSVQACVIEKAGAMASLKRSAALTKGNRLRIAALFALALSAFFLVLLIVVPVFSRLFDENTAGLMLTLFNALPKAVLYLMTSIIYYQLRCDKEGFGLESVARIFE